LKFNFNDIILLLIDNSKCDLQASQDSLATAAQSFFSREGMVLQWLDMTFGKHGPPEADKASPCRACAPQAHSIPACPPVADRDRQ
jgi:hypothetical protein